ncbi:hypothetical protein PR003_g6629 [Phytophthora rubi]|uniref:Uncharacterized protein n=1 Tax=Phytophthora rubi TaxID=129364 RepID=A0A6A4FM04_9STRA|nr:hypothetical protein PR003_g6629 [Phytophthora rubi]
MLSINSAPVSSLLRHLTLQHWVEQLLSLAFQHLETANKAFETLRDRSVLPAIALLRLSAMVLSAQAPAKVREFQLRHGLWVYTTGMAFQKAEHNSLVDALRVLTPSDVVPNRH